MEAKKRICVIGLGWNGLYGLKWAKELNPTADVVAFERDDDLGGVWHYREDRPFGSFRNTHTTASKAYLSASDFPMPDDMPHFPHHSLVKKYLLDYTEHFKLRPMMKFNTRVLSVRRKENGWEVKYCPVIRAHCVLTDELKEDEVTTEMFTHIICGAGFGLQSIPAEEEPYKSFSGTHVRACDYKWADPEFYGGKNVLVLGGGESASDITVEIAQVAKWTGMCMRSGVWMHDRLIGGSVPADVLVNRAVFVPGRYQSSLISAARMMLEGFWGVGGSGCPEWKPKAPYFRGFLNKSRDMVQEVARGRIFPRSAVTKCMGTKIWTEGRSEPDEVDIFVWATGFQRCDNLILDPKFQHPINDNYMYIFHPKDPTLSFVGTCRPVFGSFLGLAELQARYISSVIAGKVMLPSTEEMEREQAAFNKWHAEMFPIDHRCRPTLMSHWDYSDMIAMRIGAKPNLWKMYFTNPRRWLLHMTAPWTSYQYRVNEPEMCEKAHEWILRDWPDHNLGYAIAYWWGVIHIAIVHALGLMALFFLYFMVSRAYSLVF